MRASAQLSHDRHSCHTTVPRPSHDRPPTVTDRHLTATRPSPDRHRPFPDRHATVGRSAAEVILSEHERLECVYPAALALLSNLAPHARQYSYTSANLMLRMLSTLAAPAFILAGPKRPEHLIALVEVLSASLLYQHQSNIAMLQLLLLNAPVLKVRGRHTAVSWPCHSHYAT